jgi:hypothetical protein
MPGPAGLRRVGRRGQSRFYGRGRAAEFPHQHHRDRIAEVVDRRPTHIHERVDAGNDCQRLDRQADDGHYHGYGDQAA